MTDLIISPKWNLLALILLVLCISCSNQDQYVGDGDFKDFGSSISHDRYVLDFGKVDLTSTKTYFFTLSGLPREEFTIGLQISSPFQEEEHIYDTKPINPLVKIVLVNDRGELVINSKEYLKNWVWSGVVNMKNESFVYLRGTEIENSNPVQFTGFLADRGWGTYFSPKKKTSYKLTLEIIEVDTGSRPYMVTLKAKGGGWK